MGGAEESSRAADPRRSRRRDLGWGGGAARDSILFRSAHVSSGGDVLIIGDSHILICGADKAFPGCDVHARHGRASTGGLSVLAAALRPRHRVVVFDLATNEIGNPRAFESNLELLWERTGSRELVLVNTWRADGQNSHREVNAILHRFVAEHPERTVLIDWATYIDSHPGPLGPHPDYVHFTADVYRDRISLLGAAIESARRRAAPAESVGDQSAHRVRLLRRLQRLRGRLAR